MPMTPEQKKILEPYAKAADGKEEDLFKAVAKMTDEERDSMFKALKSFSAEKMDGEKKAAEAKEKAEGLETEVAELKKAAEIKVTEQEKAEQLKADLPPAALKHFEKMEADNEAARVRIEKAEGKLEAQEKAEAKRVWVEKADELKALPGEAKGDTLAEIANKGGEELAGKVLDIMKAADAALAEGDLYKEKGDNRDGSAREGSAEAKLEKMAKSFHEKSDTPMTYEQAYTKVMRLHPDLARKVQDEQD